MERRYILHVEISHCWLVLEDMLIKRLVEDSDSALAQTELKRQRLRDAIHVLASDYEKQKLRNEFYTVG
jgi:hypothetical protein